MKDPFAYFLQEGFGHMYAFPVGNGLYEARLRWATQYKDFIPSVSFVDGVSTITINNVMYIANDAFFHRYATIVDTQEEAERRIAEKNAEWKATLAEIVNI
jgi:hypothetical protein